jgi:hypothetical protein
LKWKFKKWPQFTFFSYSIWNVNWGHYFNFHFKKILVTNSNQKLVQFKTKNRFYCIENTINISIIPWYLIFLGLFIFSNNIIPTHTLVTYVQIHHFCNYKCDYLLWHLIKMIYSGINDYKGVYSCNLYLWLMSIWMKMKNTLISFFLGASQNRWKCSCFYNLEGGS